MAYIDRFRKDKKPAYTKQATTKPVGALKYLLHGSYLCNITIAEETIKYLPLTLAEIEELGETPEYNKLYAKRAIAKALRYQIDNGLETPSEYLLDTTKSPMGNVELLFQGLKKSDVDSLVQQIQMQEVLIEQGVLSLFHNNAEEYIPGEMDGIKRDSSALDDFLSTYYLLNDSSYTVHDLALLTPVQYRVIMLTSQEANVRRNNDHATHSKKMASKNAAASAKSTTKPIVGH